MENENSKPVVRAVNPESAKTRAREIMKRVAGSTNTTIVGAPPAAPVKSMASAGPSVDTSVAVKEERPVPAIVESKIEYDIDPKVELPKKESVGQDFVPEDPSNDEEVSPEVEVKFDEVAKKLLKTLRAKLKYANTGYRKSSEELETLRKFKTEVDTGLITPEVTQAQANRIAELEKYESLHNFKGTESYRERFVKPIAEASDKLVSLAKEYGVSDGVLQQAINSDGAALDDILSRNFKNTLSAMEAKNLVRDIKSTQAAAIEAEKEPTKMMARMQKEDDEILASRRAKANDVIVHTSKDAWIESLTGLREDKRFSEITFREGDTEHNEKFVKPILQKAAQEYGRTIRILAEHGLSELPKELAVKFARSDQLAHYSAVLLNQRDAAQSRVAELENLIKTKTHLNRPGINGGINGTTTSSAPANGRHGVGPENAARNVLARVTKQMTQ